MLPLDSADRPGVRFGLPTKNETSEEDRADDRLGQQEGAVHLDSEWRDPRGRVNEERGDKLHSGKLTSGTDFIHSFVSMLKATGRN